MVFAKLQFFKKQVLVGFCGLLFSVLAVGLGVQSPQRIVSLAPSLTEWVFALGAGNRLVGVVDGDYPEAARQLPEVGTAYRLNLEKIMSLHPDLVLAWSGGNSQAQVDQIQALGIPVKWVRMDHLEDFEPGVTELGVLLGKEAEAAAWIQAFKAGLLHSAVPQSHHEPSVLVVIATSPLYVFGEGSLLAQLVQHCGGRNVWTGSRGVMRPSWEMILLEKPQVVILFSQEDRWAFLHKLGSLGASTPRVAVLQSSLILRNGPRLLEGIQSLCQAIALR